MISDGTVLRGKYRVVKLLKSGGMGYIYEGEYDGNKCIIKEPKPGEGPKESNYFLEKLKIEAEILSKIKHDNIVGYIDSFEEGNSFFLVEKYVEGEKFGDKYYKNPGSEDEVINYTLQLLDAIEYLHNKHIKHRDINPNNLILSSDKKNLVLIDFGTAKYLQIGRKETTGVPKSTIVGTPYYAPPEQWEGDTSEVSDIFSVGRTMYFMLTGENPTESPYKRLDFLGKKIHKELAEVVIKATEPETKDRYNTVAEMTDSLKRIDLNALESGELEDTGAKTHLIDNSISEPPSSKPPPTKRNWRMIGFGISVAIIVIILLFILITPKLSVSSDSLNFGTMGTGATASPRTLEISNTGVRDLEWNIIRDQPWIILDRESGTNSGSVIINVNTYGLSPGSYSGTITVTSNNGETKYVKVYLNISQILLSQESFDFGTMNAGASDSRTFTISNTGGGTLTWNISADKPWITVNPTSGTNSGVVTVNVNSAGLNTGNYSGTITVNSNGGIKQGTIYLNVVQSSPSTVTSPKLKVSQYNLKFETTSTENPNDVLQISNTGGGTLEWQARADKSWIELSRSSGSNNESIIITINASRLSPGSHAGIITIESNGGNDKVAVELNIPTSTPTVTPTVTPIVTPTVTPTIITKEVTPIVTPTITPTPTLSITANPTTVIAGTATYVTFIVTSSGMAVSSATVTLSGSATETGTTDTSGNAAISVNAVTAGTITATASKTGYKDGTVTVTANQPPPLSITAYPTAVTVGALTSVTFTVTNDNTPVSGATVALSGSANGSGTTDGSGNVVISVNAATAGTITATASKTGYTNGTTTMTANSPQTLNITANPTTVTVGTATSVTFTVTSGGTAVSGVTVDLSGSATGTGTTDASGNAVISVNAAAEGTITATASKIEYKSATTTMTANSPLGSKITDFVGTWLNIDPNTGGIPKIEIGSSGNDLIVHGYGACSPTYCDWGTVTVPFQGNPVTAVYTFSFKTDTLTMTLMPDGKLHVNSKNVFTDGTNRDYTSDEYFTK